MKNLMDWIAKLLTYMNERRPEFCWGTTVGYIDSLSDPEIYRARFYGVRRRGGCKDGFGYTRTTELLEHGDREQYYVETCRPWRQEMDKELPASWDASTQMMTEAEMADLADQDAESSD